MKKALSIQWKGALNFLRGDLPLLDTVTKATAQSARRWGSAKNRTSYIDQAMMSEIRRIESREKDAVRRNTLTIALIRTRQKVRRAQAIHRCKEAAQMGAPSRLKGPPPQTKALVLD